MSQSPSQMPRDELETEVKKLRDRVDQLEEFVERVDRDKVADSALNVCLQRLLGIDIDITADPDENCAAIDVLSSLPDRVDELESAVSRLDDELSTSTDSKEGKIRAIARYAQQKRDGEAVVQVTPEEIKGATGVSERYAYKLCDEGQLPTDRDWILAADDLMDSQHGNMQMDWDGVSKRIGIDFEGVQGDPVPLNLFNNDHGGNGGEE